MPVNKKTSSIWMRSTSGSPSMSATFAVIAFFTTTVIYIASAVEQIGPFVVRPFDAAAASAYLIPVLSLYFGRRWTDGKQTSDSESTNKVTP